MEALQNCTKTCHLLTSSEPILLKVCSLMAYCVMQLSLLNSPGVDSEQWVLQNAHGIINEDDSNHSICGLISPCKHNRCYANQ